MVTKILTGSGSAERGANSSDGSRSPRASRLACSLSGESNPSATLTGEE
ncbi:hypothetical protein GOC07_28110 [Sinorhizobium meliloti]|nr:hypothetical protein [Sinorhizobium meliloti]